ncbi:MAG: LysR family transcriptional regulator [Terrimicrobiaceae bacterium]|nr:LysR family transcriptional regulator [Terrimicrobiaceae bacterium]
MLSLFQRSGLSFERLKTFCAVVDASGISQAAPGDPNRQSQFSRQIKELEEFFGTRLVNRRRGKFELTAAGTELHSIAESHFRALDNLLRRETGKTITVRVAGGESVLHGALLPLLPQLKSRLPDITLELFNCRTDETLSRLKDGRVDFGLLMDVVNDGDLETQTIGDVRLGVYIPEGIKIRSVRPDAWKLIQTLPIAALAESRSVDRLRRSAEDRDIEIKAAFLGSSYAQVLDAAKSIGCLALVPDFFVAAQESGKFFTLEPKQEFSRKLSIAWKPRNLLLNSHGTALIQELKQLIAKILSRLPGEAWVHR